MNDVQTFAVWLALSPIAAGLSVLGLFVLTDAPSLPLLGMLVLWFGFLMSVAAVIVALLGHVRARREGVRWQHRWSVSAAIATLVVSGYPLGLACFHAGWMWGTRYTVEFENRAETPWSVDMRGPGVDEVVRVTAGGQTSRTLWFGGDGELTLSTEGVDVVADEYVTNDLGGAAVAVRERDGSVHVMRGQGRRY